MSFWVRHRFREFGIKGEVCQGNFLKKPTKRMGGGTLRPRNEVYSDYLRFIQDVFARTDE